MSKIQKRINASALDGMALIVELANMVGQEGTTAALVLEIIQVIATAIHEGNQRIISPAEVKTRVEDALKGLDESIEKNKADALAAVDKKFPVTPPPPLPDTRVPEPGTPNPLPPTNAGGDVVLIDPLPFDTSDQTKTK